eukprot:TRINITY_DN261_c0_g1_i1.p1 TRINITY_DN261_c0_g1~~TRINITY_DN261_c0_g1_i1.p1  ORF type:complete len:527 (+),score=221.65 TRINITY_DN261_c0_g1_i1:62-1642(+)
MSNSVELLSSQTSQLSLNENKQNCPNSSNTKINIPSSTTCNTTTSIQNTQMKTDELEKLYPTRKLGLGYFHSLPEKLFLKILKRLAAPELLNLSLVSKALYIYSGDERIWKALCISRDSGSFYFWETWRWTYLFQRNSNPKQPFPKRLIVKDFYAPKLQNLYFRCHIPMHCFNQIPFCGVERRHISTLTFEEFDRVYDKGSKPLIIQGAMDNWPAMQKWQKNAFLTKYGDQMFYVDEVDDNCHKLVMRLRDYIRYSEINKDEDPIYLFDPKFGDNYPEMLSDYEIPIFFKEDYFNVLNDGTEAEQERPRFRWFLWGCPRSGSSFHVDFNHTSAWNALISGRKRWALYPPHICPPNVKATQDEDGEISYNSPYVVKWLLQTYPTLPAQWKPIEVIQEPGEIIWVPSGWWHMVLNLTETIAVTQNFVNRNNWRAALADLIKERDFRCLRFMYERVKDKNPQLFEGVDIEALYTTDSSDSDSSDDDDDSNSDSSDSDSNSNSDSNSDSNSNLNSNINSDLNSNINPNAN